MTPNYKTTKRRDPLPEHFGSLEEAAEFWDTHDSGNYEKYFSDVECTCDIKKRTHLISMDGSLYDEVRSQGKNASRPTSL